MDTLRLVLYDDHPVVTQAIQEYLSKYNNIKVLKTFEVVSDFLKFIKTTDVDVIITDILSCEEIGISIISQIKKHKKRYKIIAFSAISSPFIIQTLIDTGVDAFVSKRSDFENLYHKIIEVNLKTQDTNRIVKSPVKITNKERDIIQLLKEGKSAKEISEITNTSINTINNQKSHLIEKFSCANTNELLLKLISMGYLEI